MDWKQRYSHRTIPQPEDYESLVRHFKHEHGFTNPDRDNIGLFELLKQHNYIHDSWDLYDGNTGSETADFHKHASKQLPEVPESAILRHLDYDHNLNENNVDILLDHFLTNAIDVNTVSDLHDYIHEEHGHSHGFSPHTHIAGLRRSSEDTRKVLPHISDSGELARHLTNTEHQWFDDAKLDFFPFKGDDIAQAYSHWVNEQSHTVGHLHLLPDDFHEYLHQLDSRYLHHNNHVHTKSESRPLTWDDVMKSTDETTEGPTEKNSKKIKIQKKWDHILGGTMNWNNRYANENYDIILDRDDPTSIAAHIIHGHANNFDGMDDDMVQGIVNDSQHEEGRKNLHDLHNFLHRRGFMTKDIEHKHPEDN